MWINPETERFFALHAEIRAAFPNVFFPPDIAEDDIAFVGLLPVAATEPPAHDADTHNAVPAPPALMEGVWTQQWTVVAKPVPTVADLDKALTEHLDATARTRRYDNRISCALRSGYPGPFQAEGLAFAMWMDQCNALAYQLLAELQAGTRPWPASTRALIDALPAMVWPVEGS